MDVHEGISSQEDHQDLQVKPSFYLYDVFTCSLRFWYSIFPATWRVSLCSCDSPGPLSSHGPSWLGVSYSHKVIIFCSCFSNVFKFCCLLSLTLRQYSTGQPFGKLRVTCSVEKKRNQVFFICLQMETSCKGPSKTLTTCQVFPMFPLPLFLQIQGVPGQLTHAITTLQGPPGCTLGTITYSNSSTKTVIQWGFTIQLG